MANNAKIPHFSQPVISNINNFTDSWIRYFQELQNRVGGDKGYNLGGFITSNTTEVGNVGTGADDLITYDLEKNTIRNNGDTLEITVFGTTAANTNNKTIKLLLGSTELFSTGAVALNNKDWMLKASIVRTGAATQIASTGFYGDTVLVTQTSDFVAGTEDFTTIITIKCTGEATADDDIIQKGIFIKFFPKA